MIKLFIFYLHLNIVLSESWLTEDLKELFESPNYNSVHYVKKNRGGVSLFIHCDHELDLSLKSVSSHSDEKGKRKTREYVAGGDLAICAGNVDLDLPPLAKKGVDSETGQPLEGAGNGSE